MSITTLFFDLDDTLYSNKNGLWLAIRERMSDYMAEKLGMPVEIIPELRRRYFTTYGTTLRGLQMHHQVDVDDYLAYVHDLPLEKFIRPEPGLRALLIGLSQQRFIFTNADAEHAKRVLKILGIQDCFDGIIDVRLLEFACKPEVEAYERALALAGNPPAQNCAMLDDSAINLAAAKRLGMTTILVRRDHDSSFEADYALPSILELRQIAPLFDDGLNLTS